MKREAGRGIEERVRLKVKYGLFAVLALYASVASADTLQLKNGSLIKGKFLGGSDTEISFQVGSTVQKYSVADIASLEFNSDGAADPQAPQSQPQPRGSLPDDPPPGAQPAQRPDHVTIPAGTRITVRTIDSIDSSSSTVGDRFQASLAEPLLWNGIALVPQYALVHGRLTASKESGTFKGKSELSLELTGIEVNGKTVPLVTGEYGVVGKSRGASTAKRTVGGAALGAIIGAVADGGQGAAIGAGVGAGAGAASEVIVGGDQVKVPSETLLDFTLLEDVSVPAPQS